MQLTMAGSGGEQAWRQMRGGGTGSQRKKQEGPQNQACLCCAMEIPLSTTVARNRKPFIFFSVPQNNLWRKQVSAAISSKTRKWKNTNKRIPSHLQLHQPQMYKEHDQPARWVKWECLFMWQGPPCWSHISIHGRPQFCHRCYKRNDQAMGEIPCHMGSSAEHTCDKRRMDSEATLLLGGGYGSLNSIAKGKYLHKMLVFFSFKQCVSHQNC